MKKKLIKMVTIGVPVLLLFVALFIIGPSCSDGKELDQTPPECNTTNTFFQQAFTSALAQKPTNTDIVSIDINVHEYTFRVPANRKVCQIGYRSNANIAAANLPYTIEIVDAANTVVYTGNHVFSATATSYISVNFVLLANQLYTIRRILPNSGYLGNLANLTGRIVNFSPTAGIFPIANSGITVTRTNCYAIGNASSTSLVNLTLPFIDIVFEL